MNENKLFKCEKFFKKFEKIPINYSIQVPEF